MQKHNFLLLFSFLFMAIAAQAQYAKVQFSSKTPFRIEVDKEKIHEDHVSGIKLRLNQGRTYQIDLFDKATNELLVTANLPIHIHEKSAEYQLKYKKRSKSYELVEKSRKIKDPNAPKTPMTFSMEKTESYAGPDGAYSKSSKTDGTIGGGNTGFNQQKSSVSADENGISGKAENKSGNLGSLVETGNDLKMLGKALKRKKKDDGKTVVVLKSKKA